MQFGHIRVVPGTFFNARVIPMAMNCRLTVIGQMILLKGSYLEKVAGVDKW